MFAIFLITYFGLILDPNNKTKIKMIGSEFMFCT